MSVSILLITHDGIGQSIRKTATAIRGIDTSAVNFLSIPANLKPEELGYYADQVRNIINELSQGDGLLVVTDIFGATPSNLASYFSKHENIRLVSGLNLSMLVRVLNYIDRPLDDLADIAVEGGHKGIRQGL